MPPPDTETLTPDPVTPELHLPSSLGWYREAANWLVGLATAVLVYGITNIEKLPIETNACWLYGLMLLAFLMTTLSGIVFYFFITQYAHNFLRREKYASLYTLATITNDQKQTYARQCTISQQAAKSSARSYRFYFKIMIPSFLIGVLMAFSLAIIMLVNKKSANTAHVYKLQTIPVTLQIEQGAIMIDEVTGKCWVLESGTTKQLQWRLINPPEVDDKIDTLQRKCLPCKTN